MIAAIERLRRGSDQQKQSCGVRGCLGCDQVQQVPIDRVRGRHTCATCQAPMERTIWCDTSAACALASATLLALVPAETLPLMRTSLLGAGREASMMTCVRAMVGNEWPELALVVLFCAMILPIMRFALLAATLWSIMLNRRPPWLGRAFRYANALQPWAMTEVFLLGFVIAFLRLRSTIDIDIETGGLALVAAGILAMLTRAAIDKAEIWRAILANPAVAPAKADALLVCANCARVEPMTADGEPCRRCGTVLRRRKPFSYARSAALIVAGAILYFPANLYPIATLPIGAESVKYTVLEGVLDLAQAKLLGLALIVLTASFVIPILKLGGMAWCLSSVLHRSRHNLERKMRAFHFVEEIGRWSMVDPFLIACFVPVATFNAVIYGRAETGAPFFAGVVILTMMAARQFDPRLLWDAAKEVA